MPIKLDTHPKPERRPGEFTRHPHNGAPYVASLDKVSKVTGKKDDLIAMCRERGIEVPAKVTVAQLQDLLGGKPTMVMYGRPSSLGKIIEDATNLQKWAERAVALGMMIDAGASSDPYGLQGEALLDRLDRLPREQWNLDDKHAKYLLDEVATTAKNIAQTGLAADRGTHTHALTEDSDEDRDWIARAERGEDLGIGRVEQQALIEAWNKMLDQSGLEILAVEQPVVDDEWRQAGTLDRVARATKELRFVLASGVVVTLPKGWTGILDVKTGKLRIGNDFHPEYWLGYSVQIASYAKAVPYDVDANTRLEWAWPIDQQYGIIAHLDVLSALDGEARCRLILVDLEAGRYAGDLCCLAKAWGKRRDVFSLIDPDADANMVAVPVVRPGNWGPSAEQAPTYDLMTQAEEALGVGTSELVADTGVRTPVDVPTGHVVVKPDEIVEPDGTVLVPSSEVMTGDCDGCPTPTDGCPGTCPPNQERAIVDDAPDPEPVTVATNRARFDKLGETSKNKVRRAFKDGGINPNDPAAVSLVAAILANVEANPPTIGEMQQTRAVENYDRRQPTLTPEQQLAAEGGPATDEMLGEARLLFDMVIGEVGKHWTGLRVQEANAAGTPIRVSLCRSMRRAHIYLALCNWAKYRGTTLAADEAEGNVEFTLLLNMVAPDSLRDTIGERLGNLTNEEAEKLATEVQQVVEYETGGQLPIEP